jgi:hypothetical protein
MNGMDDAEDEHNFSDDGFDEFNDTTLQELEHNAILSTQQARAQPIKQPQQVISHRPVVPVPNRGFTAAHIRPNNPLQDEFDDDSFEWIGEDRVPTPVDEVRAFIPQRIPPSETTQREQWRAQRFGGPPMQAQPTAQVAQRQQYSNYQQPQTARALYNGPIARPAAPNATAFDAPKATPADRASEQDSALLARIEELTKERDKLTTELHATKTEVMTQKGEIAIIRENKNKETKVLDRQMVAMKTSMQEELAKSRASYEALSEQNSRIVSDNSFLKHELAEESEKTKTLQIRLKEKPRDGPTGPVTTPRKGGGNSLRDGFDDDEIMVMSPVKSLRRSKPPTPTAAGKRKRKADAQSPIKPLVFRNSANASDDGAVIQLETKAVTVVRKDKRTERHLRFIQKVLSYKLIDSGVQLIEHCVKYSFPSEPNRSFAGILLDGTAALSGPRIPADLLQIFLELWARSLREKYYDCVAVLMEAVDYIVNLDMSVLDKPSLTAIVPVLQDSVGINAEIRFKHSPVYHKNQNVGRPTPQASLIHAINSTSCLQLLYKIACIIASDFALIDHFWRSVSTDFILMLLNSWQPIPDISLIFSLLATSIFPDTFGNICADQVTQGKMEGYIIDRISYLLWETPKVDEGLSPPTKAYITEFRLKAMELLSRLAIFSSLPPHDDPTHHGSLLLASHPSAIARIVRSLYDSVAVLYTCPTQELTSLHSNLINMGVWLLYHLTTIHASDIDLGKKLVAVNGGINKHRVVLTRLAFSEGLYVDREVTDETVTMATAMLEESVTPDEAETLIEAFPGFTGRKKRNRDEVEMDLDGD